MGKFLNFKFKSKLRERQERLEKLDQTLAERQSECYKLQHQIGILNGIIKAEEIGLDLDYDPFAVSLDELEDKVKQTKDALARLINQKCYYYHRKYRLDDSEAKGRAFQETYVKNILLAFNTYFKKKLNGVTHNNLTQYTDLVEREFNKWENKAKLMGMSLDPDYLKLCLQLLNHTANLKASKQAIKLKLAQEKKMIAEQKKLEEEAEKERKELLATKRMYEQNLEGICDEQDKEHFEQAIQQIDKRIDDIDYQVNHKKAGWLYIASTPAMPMYVKIGVTRRLQPLMRLKELSSASVPFPFVCHGLVFSDDVFELETKTHQTFAKQRVNKENVRKEFFEVTPKIAIQYLQDQGNEVYILNEKCDGDTEDE